MAVFTINPANSVVTTVAGADAFNGDSAGTDTLVVNEGAYLLTTGATASGARLANTSAWKVTVNGVVSAALSFGILLEQGNAAVSTITIGADGDVSGGTYSVGFSSSIAAIWARSAVKLTNEGAISGARWGVFADGAATITNNGTIDSPDPIAGVGIQFASADAHTFTNSGVVTAPVAFFDGGGGNDKVTNTGTLAGDVGLGGGTNLLTNSGLIDGRVQGATGTHNDTVNNTGKITGEVRLFDGTNAITNKGTIGGNLSLDVIIAGVGNDTVTNSKEIFGNVVLGGGTNKLTNSGSINGNISAGDGDDTVTNSGTVDRLISLGQINLGIGTNTITNSGTMRAHIMGGDGNDTIVNSGTFDGVITLGNGVNTVTNTGNLSGNVVQIFGGSGVDTVNNKGLLGGLTDLGAGNDIFNGGNNLERVRDGDGSDTTKLGGGNDFYFAKRTGGADGTDTVDGGAGIDTYEASDGLGNVATGNLIINLDTVDHDFASIGFPGFQFQVKNTATGADLDGGAGTRDTITNFENAEGGSASDTIYGSALANVIEGNAGGDSLFGFGGNDTLLGGTGSDTLVGGTGRDTLNGGGNDASVDNFVFASLADSGPGKSKRDTIVGFEDGFDRIDLGLIDARSGTPANESFTYLNISSTGTRAVDFSGGGVGGELRTVWTATGYIIEGDVNGDKKADFSIDVVDPSHAILFSAADFIL